jgi:hypothetical protein
LRVFDEVKFIEQALLIFSNGHGGGGIDKEKEKE